MAEIVLGLASSHTPQMSTSAEFWKDKFERAQVAVQALGVGMAFATWNRDRAARAEQETAAP